MYQQGVIWKFLRASIVLLGFLNLLTDADFVYEHTQALTLAHKKLHHAGLSRDWTKFGHKIIGDKSHFQIQRINCNNKAGWWV